LVSNASAKQLVLNIPKWIFFLCQLRRLCHLFLTRYF